MKKKIYKKLEWLNALPEDEAERVFRECSGSHAWARQMAAQRRFEMIEHFFDRARELWIADTSPDAWPHVEQSLLRLLER